MINSSKFDAFYLKEIWDKKKFSYISSTGMKSTSSTHLKAFDKMTHNYTMRKRIPDVDFQKEKPINEWSPEEIKSFNIILQYQNEKGTIFYTEYNKGQQIFHRKLNRTLKKAISKS